MSTASFRRYLTAEHIEYGVIPHEPTMSSTRTAEACQISEDCLAKGVVLRIASRIDQQLMIYGGTGAPVSRSEPNTLVHSFERQVRGDQANHGGALYEGLIWCTMIYGVPGGSAAVRSTAG
jgi:hypothetical protein